MTLKTFIKEGLECAYIGPDLKQGPLPAFFYFSLSAEDSLNLPPYNTPVTVLESSSLRIFSISLPGHEEGQDRLKAMQVWADKMFKGENLIEDFLKKAQKIVDSLIQDNVIDPLKLGTGGLSRGGFIATHLAAKDKRFSFLLGFAPLTRLTVTDTFKAYEENTSFISKMDELDLFNLADELTHLSNIRFYIGNRDEWVSTDACYFFIRKLVTCFHERNLRKAQVELFITQSIGHKGHGTSPLVFQEGSLFAKNLLHKI